jgi:integrase
VGLYSITLSKLRGSTLKRLTCKADRGEKAAPLRRVTRKLGFTGASSHSGRRTFITQAARKIIQCGGSLRDVQELAGHASLATTQLYSGDAEAKRRVVALL